MPKCARCRKGKPESEFPIRKTNGKVARDSWCCDCRREYHKAYAREQRKIRADAEIADLLEHPPA